jgi:hypothetical protein
MRSSSDDPTAAGQMVAVLVRAREVAGSFTCREADTLALSMAELGYREEAVTFLVSHATGDDDPGDRHSGIADVGRERDDSEEQAARYLAGLIRGEERAVSAAWSLEDALAADAEGWAIFECPGSDNGPWQVQMFDDQDGGPEPYPFGSDDEVHQHVARLAAAGSALHVRALEFLDVENPGEAAVVRASVLEG